MPVTPLQISYTDPDGVSWDLSDLSMAKGWICSAIAGIEGFPVLMQTIPLLDGTAVPNLYIPQPGSIALAILVGSPQAPSAYTSGDQDDYYANLDAIVRAFYNRRNSQAVPGYIQIQRPDGSVRRVAVYTTSGLDTPAVGIHYSVYTFTLQTPDPYWTDLLPQSLTYKNSSAPGILPVLPVNIGASTIIGNATIVNAGNAQAWPTWIITGPGTPTMKNLTSGQQWALNTAIPAGQVVQVNTKPGTQMAVNVTTSTNIWDQLVLSSLRDLWALMAGTNQININMAGSSSATSVTVSWTNRWNRA